MESKIKTLITSFGMSGRQFHAPLLHAHPDFELSAVVQRSSVSARDLYPEVEVFPNLETALAIAQPDLVIVNTPPFLHKPEAILALQAGCHVVVEKPFALDVDSCQDIFREAALAGKKVTAFQNRRWDSDFLTLKKLKTENQIGEWCYFESHFDRFRPEVDLRSWKENPHEGSGLVWNLGPHLVDQMIQLLGMPEWVKATVLKQRIETRVDDFFSTQFSFRNCFAELKASYLVPGNELKYRIHGSNGTYVKHGMDVQESQLKDGISPWVPEFGIEPAHQTGTITFPDGDLEFIQQEKGNYLDFYSLLAESVHSNKPLPVTEEEILKVVKVLTAVYESSAQNKTIFF